MLFGSCSRPHHHNATTNNSSLRLLQLLILASSTLLFLLTPTRAFANSTPAVAASAARGRASSPSLRRRHQGTLLATATTIMSSSSSSTCKDTDKGPIIVVTGSNKGIGLAILKKLAPHAAVAIMATRNEALGHEAIKQLHAEGLTNISFRKLDLASPESISTFATGMEKSFGRCDILVNNAGIAFKAADPTPFKDQCEPTLRTNFWNTAKLIDAMTPLLHNAKEDPRIVNVASQSGRLAILDTDKKKQAEVSSPTLTRDRLFELMEKFETDVKSGTHKQEGWPSTCYGMSKLGLISFSKVFAREEEEKKAKGEVEKAIWIACCCPGYCDTDMTSHKGTRTPEHGARTPAWLALKGKEEGQRSGGFYYDEQEVTW